MELRGHQGQPQFPVTRHLDQRGAWRGGVGSSPVLLTSVCLELAEDGEQTLQREEQEPDCHEADGQPARAQER